MKVRWTRRAVSGLGLIADHAMHDTNAAGELGDRIRTSVNRLMEFSHSGRPGRVAETRELVVPGTKYIIPYRVKDEWIEILAVFQAARNWPENF